MATRDRRTWSHVRARRGHPTALCGRIIPRTVSCIFSLGALRTARILTNKKQNSRTPCAVGPACGANGENVYTDRIYHYFLSRASADERAWRWEEIGVWRDEEFDVRTVQKLKDLENYVYPGVCAHKNWPKPPPEACQGNLDQVGPHAGGERLMQQLPDDDSTRILSIVHSLPREVSCETFPRPRKNKNGEYDPGDLNPRCVAIEAALREKQKKLEDVTAADFQAARAACQAEQFDLNESEADAAKRTQKGSANKGCIWREGDGVYWSRDNGRDETSTALRGKSGRGGNLFQTRYFADRDIPDMGLGLLPGSHYCLGPRDRLYKSKVRFCACRPKGSTRPREVYPKSVQNHFGKVDFEDEEAVKKLMKDEKVRKIPSWEWLWERMSET
eukprot:g20470.t1